MQDQPQEPGADNPISGLDHALVLVEDLDRARDRFAALGFTLSPRGLHSAQRGTANHTIMLEGAYIELLGVLTPTPLNAERRASLAAAGPTRSRTARSRLSSTGARRGYRLVAPPVRRGAARSADLASRSGWRWSDAETRMMRSMSQGVMSCQALGVCGSQSTDADGAAC